MHGAIGAGWLGIAEHAPLEAPAGIFVQGKAFRAQLRMLGGVMAVAVHPQHGGDHPELARAPREVQPAPGDTA
jgi:hypothetical protein